MGDAVEDCVALKHYPSDLARPYYWHHLACADTAHYICQHRGRSGVPLPTSAGCRRRREGGRVYCSNSEGRQEGSIQLGRVTGALDQRLVQSRYWWRWQRMIVYVYLKLKLGAM